MAHVCPFSCACTVRADAPSLYLAVASRLAPCATRYDVHPASSLAAFSISLAVQIDLDVSRFNFVSRMASWPNIST